MRKHIAKVTFVIVAYVSLLILWPMYSYATDPVYKPGTPAVNKLTYPLLIDAREENHQIKINVNKGTHEFYPGRKSNTLGYNATYLGPAIRLYKGEDTTVSFKNNLQEITTVHGHGLWVSGKNDGGPHNKILPGKTWTVTLPIRQEASTSWFHPHGLNLTVKHLMGGLAGLYLIEDDNSLSLPIPKKYGVDDLPLVVQDRKFVKGIMDNYEERGDTIIVNGTVDPYALVPQGKVRLRLINGATERMYRFRLSDGRSFTKIALDGGFLEKPVEVKEVFMAAGERAEVIVDFSDGRNVDLYAILPNEGNTKTQRIDRVVEFRVDPTITVKNPGRIPKRLNNITWYHSGDVKKTRNFEMQMELQKEDGVELYKSFAINNQKMLMSVFNEEAELGQLERWKIRRLGANEIHTFHVHGTSFQIISSEGKPVPIEEKGWKDTVKVPLTGEVEFLVKFLYPASKQYPYMYHCHMLEHEDNGMMGQLVVTE